MMNNYPQITKVKKKSLLALIFLFISLWAISFAREKDLEVHGNRLISHKPPFTMTLPSEFILLHSFLQQNPAENSLTRVYFLIREEGKQVEEMLIVQIAEKTNPQAGQMIVPPLKPYTEKRMYLKGKVKKGELPVDYMVQLMAWNPNASSLQPIVEKGFVIPHHWALQGQFLFLYQANYAVFLRYSKDVRSFKLKVSEEGKRWEREAISGNEKKVYGIFKKNCMKMLDSIAIRPTNE